MTMEGTHDGGMWEDLDGERGCIWSYFVVYMYEILKMKKTKKATVS